jgi:AsmA protein
VNPLLALAPLIETGPGKDSDCARLLQRAQTWSEAKGAARPGAADGRR